MVVVSVLQLVQHRVLPVALNPQVHADEVALQHVLQPFHALKQRGGLRRKGSQRRHARLGQQAFAQLSEQAVARGRVFPLLGSACPKLYQSGLITSA